MRNEPFESERYDAEEIEAAVSVRGFYLSSDLVDTLDRFGDFQDFAVSSHGKKLYSFFDSAEVPYQIFVGGTVNNTLGDPYFIGIASPSLKKNLQVLEDFEEKTEVVLEKDLQSNSEFMMDGLAALLTFSFNANLKRLMDQEF